MLKTVTRYGGAWHFCKLSLSPSFLLLSPSLSFLLSFPLYFGNTKNQSIYMLCMCSTVKLKLSPPLLFLFLFLFFYKPYSSEQRFHFPWHLRHTASLSKTQQGIWGSQEVGKQYQGLVLCCLLPEPPVAVLDGERGVGHTCLEMPWTHHPHTPGPLTQNIYTNLLRVCGMKWKSSTCLKSYRCVLWGFVSLSM